MASRDIVTRAGKGSALSSSNYDQNVNSLDGTVEQQTGTTYTVVAADQNKIMEFTNASPVTVTLTEIVTTIALLDTANFKVTLKNVGAGLVTLTCSGSDAFESTATTLPLVTHQSITIQSDSTGAIWNAIGHGHVFGKQTIFIPVAAMTPTFTNGCAYPVSVETTSGRPDMIVMDFQGATADEHAQFQIAMPNSWDLGTVTFQAFWTTTATGTTGVAWGLQGVGVADGDTINVVYGTAVVVTDNAQTAANDTLVTAESAAITIAGTPANADMTYFRIFRDISDAADDMAQDARLIGIKLHFNTNKVNDE